MTRLCVVSSGGFRILQQTHTLRLSRVTVSRVCSQSTTVSAFSTRCAAASAWHLTTHNVRRFALQPAAAPQELTRQSLPTDGAHIDGTHFTHQQLVQVWEQPDLIHFCLSAGASAQSSERWHLCRDGHSYELTERGPHSYGPARQVYARPFAVVLDDGEAGRGSGGLLERHAVLFANLHAMAYGTFLALPLPLCFIGDTDRVVM